MNSDWEVQIEKELSAAQNALKDGNDGKARACVRRAVGIMISVFNQKTPPPMIEGRSAVDKLKNLSNDLRFPEQVRNAAIRLCTNVSNRLSPDFSFHPINDGKILIDHFSTLLNSFR